MVDREAIAMRQEWYCWHCGLPLGGEFAVHHRKLRKHGGTDAMSNLVALHHKCHNLGTQSVHLQPKRSYETGFLVKSYQEPAETLIRVHGGRELLLDDDGMYVVAHNMDKEMQYEW